MVYSRFYDRFYNYSGRAGTPGAPGTGEHEARSRISSPSGTPHVYPAMGPAEVHHQPMVQISTPQYASQVPPQLQMLIQVSYLDSKNRITVEPHVIQGRYSFKDSVPWVI